MRILKALALLLCLSAPALAQDASEGLDGANYSFQVVECQVHRAEIPVSDKHPQEHR